MDITEVIPHIEALIFASDKPLSLLEVTDLLNNAFGFMEDKITLDQVEASMGGIVEKYASEFYPFEVRESGGGWQFLTKKDFHTTVAQLNGDKFMKRLSAAALETLSIIAYKQPVTKGEIEMIRGVSADYAIQKLLEKELVVITGRNEKLPGHPLVYATSKSFMDYFGINSAEELPKIKEVLAEQLVEPTILADAMDETPEIIKEMRDNEMLSVTEEGQLISQEGIVLIENEAAADDDNVKPPHPDDVSEPGKQYKTDDENELKEASENDIPGDEKKQVHEENPGNEMPDNEDAPEKDNEEHTNY